jgi:hypothetical protein
MPPKPAPTEPVDPARKAGRAMAYSLKCLLDRVPGAREVLPYLAALERGLLADGPAVLDGIPLPSLRKIGAQLASLPVRPQDLPLRALQVRLREAMARRLPPTPPAPAAVAAPAPMPAPALPPKFAPSTLGQDRLEVIEVSATEFDALYGPRDQPR